MHRSSARVMLQRCNIQGHGGETQEEPSDFEEATYKYNCEEVSYLYLIYAHMSGTQFPSERQTKRDIKQRSG